jgi:hypothetical protein
VCVFFYDFGFFSSHFSKSPINIPYTDLNKSRLPRSSSINRSNLNLTTRFRSSSSSLNRNYLNSNSVKNRNQSGKTLIE